MSNLTAAVIVGSERAAIWATPESPELHARFWMHGSFVATEPRFDHGVACFPLPPESRVLRDKRWVCLVECGRSLAICRGELDPAGAAARLSSIAMLGAPPAPRVGDELDLVGLAQPGSEFTLSTNEEPWQIEISDALENPLFRCQATPSAAGVIQARVPITAAMEDEHLHVVVRRGGQVLEDLRGRFSLGVLPARRHAPMLDCRMPAHLGTRTPAATVTARAWCPWGMPAGGAHIACVARAVGLPGPESDGRFQTTAPASYNADLDDSGIASIELPLSYWNLPEGPRVLGAWLRVTGWEGQQTVEPAATLFADQPVYGWLACDPAEPTVGEPARLKLAWFDPTGLTGIQQPKIEVHRDGQGPTQLQLFAEIDGLTSEPWYPANEGSYDVVANIARLDGEQVCVTRQVHVLPEPKEADGGPTRIRCDALATDRNGKPGVLVRLIGRNRQPAVVLVEAGDPLAAASLPPFDGTRELFLPVASVPAGTRVMVVTAGATGSEILASAEAQPDAAREMTLSLETPQAAPLPGGTLHVNAACTRGGAPLTDASIIARLVPARDSGHVSWLPGRPRETTGTATSFPAIASSGGAAQPAGGDAPDASICYSPSRDRLLEAMYKSTTLWVGTCDRLDDAGMDVPLPAEPGLYRLIAVAIAPGGTSAVDDVLIDTRTGPHVAVDAPEKLTSGDRTVVAVMIGNVRPEPIEVDVRVDAGPGLHVESALVGERALSAAAIVGAAVHLTVPAEDRCWLQVRVEAAEPGNAALRAEVTSAIGTQHATTTCEVIAAEPSQPPDGRVHLKRTLLRLAEESILVDPVTYKPSDTGVPKMIWREYAIAPGESVVPGTNLLVREEVTLSEPCDHVEWTQRAPANCHVVQANSRARHTLGDIKRRRLCQIEYTAAKLEVGFRTHEYHIVAMRPGVCRVPAPEASADGRPLIVSVEPAELLVNVVGTP